MVFIKGTQLDFVKMAWNSTIFLFILWKIPRSRPIAIHKSQRDPERHFSLACVLFVKIWQKIWFRIIFNVERDVLLLNVARDVELWFRRSYVFTKCVELRQYQSNWPKNAQMGSLLYLVGGSCCIGWSLPCFWLLALRIMWFWWHWYQILKESF